MARSGRTAFVFSSLAFLAVLEWNLAVCPCDMRRLGASASASDASEESCCARATDRARAAERAQLQARSLGEGRSSIASAIHDTDHGCGKYGKQWSQSQPAPQIDHVFRVVQDLSLALIAPPQSAASQRAADASEVSHGVSPPDLVVVNQRFLI